MNPFFIVLAVLTFGLLSLSSAQNAADLFKSGRIRLAEEVRLSDKNLPENALFQNPRGLAVDGRGRLWVQVFTPERETNVFDIFGPKWEFLNRVAVEGASIDAQFMSSFEKRFAADVLWKIEKDPDGFASLVKYRLTPGKSKRIGKRALLFPNIH
jgi:hypothetical protein